MFQPVVEGMRQRSPAFRRQVARIGAARTFRVRVLPEDRPRPTAVSDARTAFTFDGGTLVSAHVYLRMTPQVPRFIAHEMEHILEQLDGIDLQAQDGNGVVWKSNDTTFETRRAIEAGLLVEQEVARDAGRGEPQANAAAAGAFQAIVQRERDGVPLSERTGRLSANGRFVALISAARLVERDRNDLRDVYVFDGETGGLTLETLGHLGQARRRREPRRGHQRRRALRGLRRGSRQPDRPLLRSRHVSHIPAGPHRRHDAAVDDQCQRRSGEWSESRPGHRRRRHDGSVPVGGDRSPGPRTRQRNLPRQRRLRDDDARGRGRRRRLASRREHVTGDQRRRPLRGVCLEGRLDVHRARPMRRGNGVADVYVRDTRTNTTRRISRSVSGAEPNGASYDPAISGNGRYVAFVSEASNLTRDAVRRGAQIYVHDLLSGATELITRTRAGRPANGSSLRPALSHDGQRIAYQSLASDLLCDDKCKAGQADINLLWDVYPSRSPDRADAFVRAATAAATGWSTAAPRPSMPAAASSSSSRVIRSTTGTTGMTRIWWSRPHAVAGSGFEGRASASRRFEEERQAHPATGVRSARRTVICCDASENRQ